MNNKQIIYVWAGAFTAATILLAVFLVYPLLLDIQRGSGEILLARAGMITIELENREVSRFQKNIKTYQPDFTKADGLMVDAKDPIDFIEFLEVAAVKSGIDADIRLVSSKGQTLNTWPTLVFQVFTNGSFFDTMAFSKKLETGPYLTSIQKLSIKKHENITGAGKTVAAGAIDADVLLRVVAK